MAPGQVRRPLEGEKLNEMEQWKYTPIWCRVPRNKHLHLSSDYGETTVCGIEMTSRRERVLPTPITPDGQDCCQECIDTIARYDAAIKRKREPDAP